MSEPLHSAERDVPPVCLLHPLVNRVETCAACSLTRPLPPADGHPGGDS